MTDKGCTEGGGLHNQQMEKFTSLNPQGMALNGWLNIHFEKGLDATENMQRNDIRFLKRNEKAHIRLWKWRDASGMYPVKIEELIRMDKRSHQVMETGLFKKRAGNYQQRKWTS
jgi:hypothetical protein